MNAWWLLLVVLALALASIAGLAPAQPANEVIDAINAYRVTPQSCEGRRTTPARRLVANSELASRPVAHDAKLLDELKANGYQAAEAHIIVVSGPPSVAALMNYIETRYCQPLTSAQFTEAGVRHAGLQWQVILAKPLLSRDLRDWRAEGEEILRLTNQARASPRSCGGRKFGPAQPLAWDEKLAEASLAHSRDMANRNYLDHIGKDGSDPGARASRQGYPWLEVGENVAGGQCSALRVVNGWLGSPHHCANLMNGRFVNMGAAYAVNPRSDTGIAWTQMFGRTP